MSDDTNITTANDGKEATTVTTEATPSTAAVEPAVTPVEKVDNSLDAVISRTFDKLSKKEPVVEKPVVTAAAVPANDGKVMDPVSGRVLDPIKAPVLPVSLRDKWASIPRDFQQYWADRERDMAKNLQDTSDARKLANEWKDVVQPYEAMLRQHNISGMQHAKNLFITSHSLTTGTPQEKAHIFYELLSQFKPDPATLQALISKKPIPQGQQQAPVDINTEIDKKLNERDEGRQIADGKSALEVFKADPKNEFVEDVRDLMAKAIDAGFVSGSTWPELFKNAYDFACQQHPEVKKALAQRATATATANPSAAAPVVQAVPSIKPSLGSGNRSAPPKKKMSTQEAAEYAWKQLGGQ